MQALLCAGPAAVVPLTLHATLHTCRHYLDGLLVAVVALCTLENDIVHAAYLALALAFFRSRIALRVRRNRRARVPACRTAGQARGIHGCRLCGRPASAGAGTLPAPPSRSPPPPSLPPSLCAQVLLQAKMEGSLLPPSHRAVQAVRRVGTRIAKVRSALEVPCSLLPPPLDRCCDAAHA